MLWWQVLLPAIAIALTVRLVAVFSPAYFTFIELFSEVAPEGSEVRHVRRRVMGQRIAVPLIVAAIWALLLPESNWIDGMIVGALGAGLLIWPILFNGTPVGVYTNKVLPVVVYTLVVGIFATAGGIGVIAIRPPSSSWDDGAHILSNLATGFLLTSVGAVLWWLYDFVAAFLGRRYQEGIT